MDDRSMAIMTQKNGQEAGRNYVVGSIILLLRTLNNLEQDWLGI